MTYLKDSSQPIKRFHYLKGVLGGILASSLLLGFSGFMVKHEQYKSLPTKTYKLL